MINNYREIIKREFSKIFENDFKDITEEEMVICLQEIIIMHCISGKITSLYTLRPSIDPKNKEHNTIFLRLEDGKRFRIIVEEIEDEEIGK